MKNIIPSVSRFRRFTTASVLSVLSLSLSGCLEETQSFDEIFGECSVSFENRELVSFLRDRYLWNDDLPMNISPNNFSSPYELLASVRAPQDRFSFILTEQEYIDRYINAQFIGLGFGRQDLANGNVMVRYVYDGSPAETAGLRRGDQILAVNERTVASWQQEYGSSWANRAFGGGANNVDVTLEWQQPDGTIVSALMTTTEVSTNTVMAIDRFTVPSDAGNRDVGYFVFDSFINRAEDDINQVMDELDGVDELIIDVRYNGGGLVRVANQIASQTSWEQVAGNTFLTYQYNNNRNDQNLPFDLGAGINQLNLDRVIVLTTAASCSASELVANSLSPFVEVVTVGSPTCGKPVGQEPRQICDKIIFAITFQTVNADGNGDYFNGIQPTCPAPDTIVGDWGDDNDPMLAEALGYIETGSCTAGGAGGTSITTSVPAELQHALEQRRLQQVNPITDKYDRNH